MNPRAIYETLLKYSAQMAKVAKDQDWDALGRLQEERASLLASLPARLPPLSPVDSEQIRIAIQQIQAHDATVLEYVLPWREQVGQLISKLTPSA